MTTAPPTPDDQTSGLRSLILLACIVALAFFLRAWNLHAQGLTADEVREVNSAHASFWSIVCDQDDDRFPPLYRIVLATTVRAAGTDLAARWLSLACGVAAVLVAWRAGVELIGPRAGLWSALVLACCPFHIHYSREGRAYAFYFLFCSLAVWATLRLYRDRRLANWIFLGAASLLALYSHYFAAPLLVVLWVVALGVTYGEAAWWRGWVALLATVVGTIPAALLYLAAIEDLPTGSLVSSFDVEAWGYTFMSLVSGYTLGPSMRELRSIPAAEGIRQMLPWLAAVGLAIGVLTYHAICSLRSPKRIALFALLLVFAVPLIGWGGNLAGVGYNYRYVVWIAFPFVLWLGAGASRSTTSKAALAATVLLLGLNAIAWANRLYDPRYGEEDFRAVAHYLESAEAERRPILFASPYMATALEYYLDDQWQVASFPIFDELAEQREQDLAAFHAAHPPGTKYWFLVQWLPDDDKRRPVVDQISKQLGVEFLTEVGMMEIGAATR